MKTPAIRLSNIGPDLFVHVEHDGEWHEVIREHAPIEQAISHIVEPRAYGAIDDDPVFQQGRHEGWSDIAAKLRAIVDPNDVDHLNIDGLLVRVAVLYMDHADALRLLGIDRAEFDRIRAAVEHDRARRNGMPASRRKA